MNTPISRKYIIIPILYAAVLAVLFILQFSGRSTTTEALGSLEITAYSGGNGGNVERITLEHPAITFEFSRSSTLLVRTEFGRTVEAGILEFRTGDTGAELRFDEGITLEITVSPDGFTLTPRFEDITGIETLEIPFAFPETAALETATDLPAARIDPGEGEYFAALPRKGRIEGSTFVLPTTAGGLGRIRIDPLDGDDRGLYAVWFSRSGDLPTEEEFRRRVEEYRDKAYLGWTEGRFRGAAGWLYPSGQVGFLEDTLLAAVSEAVRRLDDEAYESLTRAAETNQDALTFRSSVYLGGPREANREISEEGWGPEALREAVLSVPTEISLEELSVSEGIDLLGVYTEAIRRIGDVPTNLELLRRIVEKVVFPAVAVTEAGLFLETDPGFCDTAVSLEAGRILEILGHHEDDETLAAVGRGLVTAQIAASDEYGFCPGGYSLEAGGAEPGTMPLVTAEAVFEAAFPGDIFPRWVPLGGGLESGRFVFTGVPVEVDLTDGTGDTESGGEARMSLRFFPGRSHYLIVRGIETLRGIELHDLNWRSDPQFDIYTTGYTYDADSASLLIKLGHRDERTEEPVILRY